MRTRSYVYDIRRKSNKADIVTAIGTTSAPFARVRCKSDNLDKLTTIGAAPARSNSVISCVGYDDLSAAGAIRARQSHRRTAMREKLLARRALFAGGVTTAPVPAQWASTSNAQPPIKPRQLPEYTASGELVLPKDYHEWVYVGSPLTPNALNGGMAGFPEF